MSDEGAGGESTEIETVSVAPRDTSGNDDTQGKTKGDKTVDPTQPFKVRRLGAQADRQQRRAGGKRSKSRTNRKTGRYISSRPSSQKITDLALDATIRAAAPFQRRRREQSHAAAGGRPTKRRAVLLERPDYRQKIRVRRTRNAICFVVDASWSMAAEQRMQATKSAVLSLLKDAYQRRDRVGMVSFQRDSARVLLPLTNSVDLAERRLRTMPTGGKTPLTHGLLLGFELLDRAKRRDPEVLPLMVVLTDGQANVSLTGMRPQEEAYRIADYVAEAGIEAIVIDTEHPSFVRGLAQALAQHLHASYYHIANLGEGALVDLVRQQTR
ncbi:MAG: VWA domain-containing protein [Chloroflexota bacterium]|nr:VWA domain-containing protein [Chloroflexota bacterium]